MAEREGPIGDALRRTVTRRQLLQAGAVGSAAAFIAACGGTTATAAPTAAPTAAATAAATAAPTAAPTAAATAAPTPAPTPEPTPQRFDGTTLAVWSGGTSFPPIDAASAEWEAETGGKVNREVVPFAERAIKFAGLIATQDSSIDVLYATGQFVGQFADRLYEGLGSLGVDTSDFVPAIIPILSSGGNLRAIPEHSEMEIFIFNKQYFADAGLDPEQKSWTWEELYAKAPQLTSGNRYPCAVPWASGGAYWLCFYNSIPGAEFLSEDRTQVLFNNENGLLVFETIRAGIEAGFFDPAFYGGVDDYATGRVFNGGGTASQINFSELWAQAVSGNEADFGATLDPAVVGASIVPGIAPGTSGTINGFEGFGINVYGTQKEAALSLVNKLGSLEFQKKMIGFSLPSSRVSVLTDPEQLAKFPVGSVLAEQGTYNLNRYSAPYDWTPPMNEAITRLISGGFTPSEALQFSTKGIQEIIINYLSS